MSSNALAQRKNTTLPQPLDNPIELTVLTEGES